ncbi:FHA domain-containing protein [Nocardia sp. 2]|uniref:FHA domain-containing protein n=1 Tax=Nocardia acididurans TaxID=2802282 RepID=A0ABS1MIE7_9NOCA|nr:BTAD domain-containing putative transcriptional regulator [Nocardia acididurans]MBL1080332.1 FHA domain-containing protein [Nocardia acididurans]
MIDRQAPGTNGSGGFDLRLLGPAELRIDDRVVPLGGTIPTGVLAYLALNRERAVPTEVLADRLAKGKEADPPDVHVAIWKLRQALSAQSVRHEDILVNTRGSGFRLVLDESCCDVFRFRAARAAANDAVAAGEYRKAAELYRRALREGRGTPLSNLPDFNFIFGERSQLENDLQACLEARIDADIETDPRTELIGELTALTHDEVMQVRERLWAQLATVQYLNARQADALTTLRRARAILGEVEGIDPGPELVELERKIHQREPLRPQRIRPIHMPTTVARDAAQTSGRLQLDDGTTFLVSKPVFTIGRHPDNDLELDDAQASREHAKILQSAIGLIIRDLDSTNGVFVDDKRINQTATIKDKTVIRIGTTSMVFHQD